jgi:hypothetical protein
MPVLHDSVVATGTAAGCRSGDAADSAVLDSAPSADAVVSAAEADSAAVATLRELCCDGASPEFLAHVLMRRCHGDLEVNIQEFYLLVTKLPFTKFRWFKPDFCALSVSFVNIMKMCVDASSHQRLQGLHYMHMI